MIIRQLWIIRIIGYCYFYSVKKNTLRTTNNWILILAISKHISSHSAECFKESNCWPLVVFTSSVRNNCIKRRNEKRKEKKEGKSDSIYLLRLSDHIPSVAITRVWWSCTTTTEFERAENKEKRRMNAGRHIIFSWLLIVCRHKCVHAN